MYRHRQTGWLMMAALGLLSATLASIAYSSRQAGPLVPLCIVLLALILFCSITVALDENQIEVRFGPGWVKKRWRLAEIQSCRPVRNRWWYGWGIRWIGRRKWLFNVAGLDAVELAMKDGTIYRIGTDEPQKLSELIQDKLKRAI